MQRKNEFISLSGKSAKQIGNFATLNFKRGFITMTHHTTHPTRTSYNIRHTRQWHVTVAELAWLELVAWLLLDSIIRWHAWWFMWGNTLQWRSELVAWCCWRHTTHYFEPVAHGATLLTSSCIAEKNINPLFLAPFRSRWYRPEQPEQVPKSWRRGGGGFTVPQLPHVREV
jgi:hypothetical protein